MVIIHDLYSYIWNNYVICLTCSFYLFLGLSVGVESSSYLEVRTCLQIALIHVVYMYMMNITRRGYYNVCYAKTSTLYMSLSHYISNTRLFRPADQLMFYVTDATHETRDVVNITNNSPHLMAYKVCEHLW